MNRWEGRKKFDVARRRHRRKTRGRLEDKI